MDGTTDEELEAEIGEKMIEVQEMEIKFGNLTNLVETIVQQVPRNQ